MQTVDPAQTYAQSHLGHSEEKVFIIIACSPVEQLIRCNHRYKDFPQQNSQDLVANYLQQKIKPNLNSKGGSQKTLHSYHSGFPIRPLFPNSPLTVVWAPKCEVKPSDQEMMPHFPEPEYTIISQPFLGKQNQFPNIVKNKNRRKAESSHRIENKHRNGLRNGQHYSAPREIMD